MQPWEGGVIVTFLVWSDEAVVRFMYVSVAGKTSVSFCWLSDSMLKSLPQRSIYQHFRGFGGEILEITCHAHSSWQPYCSAMCFGGLWHNDLITPFRWVDPVCSLHMKKTHPTVPGYLEWLTMFTTCFGGVPQLTWECNWEKRRDGMDGL